jgi:hypothetical protein
MRIETRRKAVLGGAEGLSCLRKRLLLFRDANALFGCRAALILLDH